MHYLNEKISESDKLIIQELGRDATQTSNQIAKKLGMSASTVRRRVSKLIKSGVLRIIAVPNPKVIGEEGWAVLGLSVALDMIDRIEDQLAVYDEVYTIASSFGRFEIIVLAQFPSIDQLKAFVREELARIPGIKGVETFVLTRPKKLYGLI